MYHSGMSFGTKCSLPASYSTLINLYIRRNQRSVPLPSVLLFYHNSLILAAHQSINEPKLKLLSTFALESTTKSAIINLLKVDLPGQKSK